MNATSWNDSVFWEQACVKRSLASEARRAGGEDMGAPMGAIWLTLQARRPSGEVSGDRPEAFLGKTVCLEARKFFGKQRRSLIGSGMDFDSIPAFAPAPEVDALDGELLKRLLSELDATKRDFIVAYFGVGGTAVPAKVLAEQSGCTTQAVYKRKNRVVRDLKRIADKLGIHADSMDARR